MRSKSVSNHVFNIVCTTLVIGTAALPAGLAFADARPADAEQAMETVVSVATRQDAAAADIAQSISQLDREAIALIGQAHIQEVLLRIPGANLHRGNGQEYLPAIRSPVLTGAGGCGAVLMLENNIPLRPAGFCNINELFEAHTEQAEKIEVLRGPGSAFYGSNALHGVVNVLTVPRGDEYSSDTPNFLGLDAGPHDYARARMALGGQRGGIKLTAAHDGGYRDESGYDQQKITAWRHASFADYDLEFGMTVVNLEQETAGFIEGLDAYKDPAIAESNPNPEAFRDAVAARAWSRFSIPVAEDSQLLVTPYVRYSDMDFLQHFLPGDPLEENGQASVGVQSGYYVTGAGDAAVNWSVGLDAEYTSGYLKQGQAFPTQGSEFLQETVPVGKHYDYDVDALMAAGFASLDWRASEDLTVSAGVRYEHLDYDYDNRMLDGRTRDDGTTCGRGGCRYSRPGDRSDSFGNWSPKLGFIYRLAPALDVTLSIARGFRAPQATELYRLQRDQVVADLESEQLDSVDLGVRGELGALDYKLSIYYMEKNHFIFRDSDFFTISDGETRHSGLELELDYRFNEQWDIGLNASIAEHSYTYHDVLDGVDIYNNDVDTAPNVFGSAQLGWRFAPEGRAELEWVHMGDYYLDPANLHRYEGHDVLNLRASYAVSSRWTLGARLLNATDTQYAERADYTSFSEERYFPGEPRSVFVSAEYRW